MYDRPNANPARTVPPPPLCLGGRLGELSKPINNATTGAVINRRRHAHRHFGGGLHPTKPCLTRGESMRSRCRSKTPFRRPWTLVSTRLALESAIALQCVI